MFFSRNPVTFWFVSMPIFLWIVFSKQTMRFYHIFSIPELARTLFAPWKRDEISMEGFSLGDKFHIWIENLATRFIAFIIRSITIGVGFASMAAWFVLGLILILLVLIWPLMCLVVFYWGVR